MALIFSEKWLEESSSIIKEVQLTTNWDDVSCPICLDFPHNSVLLQCSSYEKGCRPFVCDTNYHHSNCFDRFKSAYGFPLVAKPQSSEQDISKPSCPLCRGEVSGWVIIYKARLKLDEKKRSCEDAKCSYKGNYAQLQKHAQQKHPHSRPSKIDPVRQLDWVNLQRSSETIDVLSTIYSEVPRGVVLGDYVIEYGGDETGDEFEEFHGAEGKWWTSCIFYHVFDKLRISRNRRKSRVSDTRRGRRSNFDTSNPDDGLPSEFSLNRIDEIGNDSVSVHSRISGSLRSSRNRSSRRETLEH